MVAIQQSCLLINCSYHTENTWTFVFCMDLANPGTVQANPVSEGQFIIALTNCDESFTKIFREIPFGGFVKKEHCIEVSRQVLKFSESYPKIHRNCCDFCQKLCFQCFRHFSKIPCSVL